MAIYRLVANGSFGPEETKAVTAAYEAVLHDLALVDRDNPLTEIAARAIVGRWRERGAQMPMLAACIDDPNSKKIMLEIARSYERLADRTEIRTDGHGVFCQTT